MIDFTNSQISNIVIHQVGNKSNDENCKFSSTELKINDEVKNILHQYFITPFKSEEYFNFSHDSELYLNEAYSYVTKIFDNPSVLIDESIKLAKHLFESSTHPKIKSGEFYVIYFSNIIIDNTIVDGIGLFKSENKDTFIKVYPNKEGFQLECDKGVNINKLDKGCIICNIEKEKGYVVTLVDNTNKGLEAKYWTEDFLRVSPRNDEYHNTQDLLMLYKKFVLKTLPEQFEVTKIDQTELLNNSISYLKQKETFSMDEFTKNVIHQPDLIESFNNFRSIYQNDRDITISENFSISDTALKKQSKLIKSVIKLDKNFDIYIHGSRDLIEQGVDEKGRKYYKIYYKDEI